MGNNLEILNEWNVALSNYKTFKFIEAQELYCKLMNMADNNLKRQYFIIVTEGMFKKGKLLKNIGNKFKKLMPSLDTNYKNLFNDN